MAINKMILQSPIFSLHALCCSFFGIPKQLRTMFGMKKVIMWQYVPQRVGVPDDSLTFWRLFSSAAPADFLASFLGCLLLALLDARSLAATFSF